VADAALGVVDGVLEPAPLEDVPEGVAEPLELELTDGPAEPTTWPPVRFEAVTPEPAGTLLVPPPGAEDLLEQPVSTSAASRDPASRERRMVASDGCRVRTSALMPLAGNGKPLGT
jgi:hypothetical protein